VLCNPTWVKPLAKFLAKGCTYGAYILYLFDKGKGGPRASTLD